MPRKRSITNSRSADTCPCGCCKWHSSSAVRTVLAVMFVLIVVAFAASLIYSANSYFGASILSFMGVIFLVVFVGWVFGFFCSCGRTHLSRHGYEMLDNPRKTLRQRYASGEITKKEYDKMMSDIE